MVRAADDKFEVTVPEAGTELGLLAVMAEPVTDQPVSFGVEALSRALTLKVYKVLAVKPVAVYVVLVCQELLLLASVVHSK